MPGCGGAAARWTAGRCTGRRPRVDVRLAVGSLVFGAGWGLAGFCPGPALVNAAAGLPQALIFVAAMVAGIILGPRIPEAPPIRPQAGRPGETMQKTETAQRDFDVVVVGEADRRASA